MIYENNSALVDTNNYSLQKNLKKFRHQLYTRKSES